MYLNEMKFIPFNDIYHQEAAMTTETAAATDMAALATAPEQDPSNSIPLQSSVHVALEAYISIDSLVAQA